MKNVTIGIPAFNEEANIAHVVQAMLNQNEDGFVIDKIIVASDGSSDATAAIVRSIKDERLVLIDEPIRRGKIFVLMTRKQLRKSPLLYEAAMQN
jgi:glycosyltransferase involved in cell wall biosynthesis